MTLKERKNKINARDLPPGSRIVRPFELLKLSHLNELHSMGMDPELILKEEEDGWSIEIRERGSLVSKKHYDQQGEAFDAYYKLFLI